MSLYWGVWPVVHWRSEVRVHFFEAPVRRLTAVLSRLKVSGVEVQMILDESGNEVIAVVIAVLHAHFDRIVCGLAGLFD